MTQCGHSYHTTKTPCEGHVVTRPNIAMTSEQSPSDEEGGKTSFVTRAHVLSEPRYIHSLLSLCV